MGRPFDQHAKSDLVVVQLFVQLGLFLHSRFAGFLFDLGFQLVQLGGADIVDQPQHTV